MKKNKKKIILVLLIIVLLCVLYLLYRGNSETESSSPKNLSGLKSNHLIIPKINLDEPVYDDKKQGGVSSEFLNKGLSYYDENTNKPGQGNVVIFGHSAVTSEHNAPFKGIGAGEIQKGDNIILTDKNGDRFIYKVSEIKTISNNDFSIIKPTTKKIITLVTCIAPDFPKDKRLVVIGDLKQ